MKRGDNRMLLGQLTRLAVFRYLKQNMTPTRCPTATEVASELAVSVQTACLHMMALKNAAGLPGPIPNGHYRTAERHHENHKAYNKHGEHIDVCTHFARQGFE